MDEVFWDNEKRSNNNDRELDEVDGKAKLFGVENPVVDG
jgi:hypothetical protein